MDIVYNAEPTASKFHLSNAFVRGIRGSRRVGKSTACGCEVFRRGREQDIGPDGLRHTRFAIIRTTYRELEDTTLATWLNWFPEDVFGRFNYHKMTHHIRKADMDMEVLFRSLERPADIGKLLSLELTGAWLNEAKQMYSVNLLDGLIDTLGQFTAKKDGGCTWSGLIMDTNSCDKDHWWYEKSEKVKPEGWEFFNPPGAVLEINGKFIINPKAENLCN